MEKRNGYKVFILIACIGLSLFGLYMQFIHKSGDPKETKPKDTNQQTEYQTGTEAGSGNDSEAEENTGTENPYDYSQKELPDTDNESQDETFTYKNDIHVYFTNTELLDNGNMPLAAQAELSEDVQRYLNLHGYGEASELSVDPDTYIEDGEHIEFLCDMDAYEDRLMVEYSFTESKLKFSIILH